MNKQISKTALGAENAVRWHSFELVEPILAKLKSSGYTVCALEQAKGSTELHTYKTPEKIAILVGREVEGIEPEVLKLCDEILEIPMAGKKESFNVAQAAAMAMFYCRFI